MVNLVDDVIVAEKSITILSGAENNSSFAV
jgi:hypothetical protein